MIGLCLGLAGAIWAQLDVSEFTLAWRHTVEHVRWEEDYQLTPAGLLLKEARIKGSGAGMEIPADAERRDGSWRYQPHLPPLQPLRLGRTPQAGDYELCSGQQCDPLSRWLGPPTAETPFVELWSCQRRSNPGLAADGVKLPEADSAEKAQPSQ